MNPSVEASSFIQDCRAALARFWDEVLTVDERDGWELRKAIRLPLEGVDIQLFGEVLVSLAHLIRKT